MTTRHLDPITGIDTILPDDPWVDVVVGSLDGLPVINPASEEFGEFIGSCPDAVCLDFVSASLLAQLWREAADRDDIRLTVRALVPRLSGWAAEMERKGQR